MNAVYKHIRSAYKAGKFCSLRVDCSSGFAWIEDENGYGLQMFVTYADARAFLEQQREKASKWIK